MKKHTASGFSLLLFMSLFSTDASAACVGNRTTNGGALTLVSCMAFGNHVSERVNGKSIPGVNSDFFNNINVVDKQCGYEGGIDQPTDYKISVGKTYADLLLLQGSKGVIDEYMSVCNLMMGAAGR